MRAAEQKPTTSLPPSPRLQKTAQKNSPQHDRAPRLQHLGLRVLGVVPVWFFLVLMCVWAGKKNTTPNNNTQTKLSQRHKQNLTRTRARGCHGRRRCGAGRAARAGRAPRTPAQSCWCFCWCVVGVALCAVCILHLMMARWPGRHTHTHNKHSLSPNSLTGP